MKAKQKNTILEIVAIALFVLFMLPFALVIINAAKPSLKIIMDPLAFPENPAQLIANITTVFTSPNVRYASSFFSTLIITVSSAGRPVLISSMGAWVLVRTKTKLSNAIFMVFVAAMVIPFQVVMFPLITWFHILEVKLDLEEAAVIDGCSRPSVFFRIVFPILTPVTVTVIILNGIWIWNNYLLPLMLPGSGNAVRTLPLAVAGFVGSFVKKWDLILTATLMTMLPIVIVFLVLQKYIIKGMVDGSVKG